MTWGKFTSIGLNLNILVTWLLGTRRQGSVSTDPPLLLIQSRKKKFRQALLRSIKYMDAFPGLILTIFNTSRQTALFQLILSNMSNAFVVGQVVRLVNLSIITLNDSIGMHIYVNVYVCMYAYVNAWILIKIYQMLLFLLI
jgi:hypothetical protein